MENIYNQATGFIDISNKKTEPTHNSLQTSIVYHHILQRPNP